jgi:hypothetical protein
MFFLDVDTDTGVMSQSQPFNYETVPSANRLRLAGYLAMISAMLALPWFLFTFTFAERNDFAVTLAEAGMMTAGLALLIYLMITFRQLLNRKYAFHHADKTISLLIQASICQTAAGLLGMAIPELEGAVRIYGLVLAVIIGILHMMFGIWLLQLPASLGGMHRPYCYLNIVTGFSLASIMLLPLGILTGCITDVMLGTIFLQAITDRTASRVGLG